jgi:PAS domain S-box-containing protein
VANQESSSSLKDLIMSSTEVLYEDAPCGYIFTYPNGLLIKVNRTFLNWFDFKEEDVVEKKKFQELLSIGSRIYYDTNYAPLLRMQGFLNEITLDLNTTNRGTMPVLISSSEMKDENGEVLLIKSTLFDISDRRKYEKELLIARHEAEQAAVRAHLLARVGEHLRAESEIQTQLQKVAELATEAFCDVCAIDLLIDGQWKRVGQDHINRDQEIPQTPHELHSLKESMYVSDVDKLSSPSESFGKIIEILEPQSFIVVPIRKNRIQVGTICFFLTRLGKRYSTKDYEFTEELAFSLCSALERAELNLENERITKELRESHEWFSTTLKSIGDAVLVITTEKKLSYLNPVAEELTGWTNQEAKGLLMEEVFKIVNEQTGLPAFNPVDRVLQEGKATMLENHTALIRRDGTRIIIEDSAAPIKDEKTQYIHGVVLIFRDTTQKYIQEKKRTELLNELKTEKDVREKFVATLTHDLRSPLSSIKLSVELLQRKYTDEKASHITQRAIKGISRVDRMIQDLLDANRLRAGESIPMDKSEMDLALLAREVIDELTLIHGKRFHLQSSEVVKGVWNSDGLRRILENLCNNAIKYGNSESLITVSISSQKKNVLIAVHNEGNPIPAEEQVNLFEPFKRINTQDKNRPLGWGLGLSLVKGVAESHQGSVSLSSSQDNGTTFMVTLPLESR